MHLKRIAIVAALLRTALPANAESSNGNSQKLGPWTIVSSKTFQEGEVGAMLTTYSVYLDSGSIRELRETFIARRAGDGGETWEKLYRFDTIGGSLRATETSSHFEPTWELAADGGVGFREEAIRVLRWDGSGFILQSSRTVSQLYSMEEKSPAAIEINGEFSDKAGDSGESLVAERGSAIGLAYDWGTPYVQVRLADGRVGYVKWEAIRLSKPKK